MKLRLLIQLIVFIAAFFIHAVISMVDKVQPDKTIAVVEELSYINIYTTSRFYIAGVAYALMAAFYSYALMKFIEIRNKMANRMKDLE